MGLIPIRIALRSGSRAAGPDLSRTVAA